MSDMTPFARRRLSGRDGFTLVEVLVALAILAIALVTLIRLLLVSVSMTDHARDVSRATLLAQARMDEALSSRNLEPDSPSGRVEGEAGEPTLQWETTVTDKSIAALESVGVQNLREVKVRVSWGKGDGERSIEMATLVAGQDEP